MKKTGRNDPCPCGSGKKFKKCCERSMLGKKFKIHKIDNTTISKTINLVKSAISDKFSHITTLFHQKISQNFAQIPITSEKKFKATIQTNDKSKSIAPPIINTPKKKNIEKEDKNS